MSPIEPLAAAHGRRERLIAIQVRLIGAVSR